MPSSKFCFLCGSQSEDLFEGMCSSCFIREKEPVSLPKKMKAQICRDCLRFYTGRWEDGEGSVDRAIRKLAEKEVEKNLKHRLVNIKKTVSIIGTEEKGKGLVAGLKVAVQGVLSGLEYRTELYSNLEIKAILCPVCSRRSGGYYEAVIQIRSDPVEEVVKEVKEILENRYTKDKMAFIVQESTVKGGLDIKIGSTKAAKAVAVHFKSQHKAEIKESATLVGRKEGKDLYRVTILIRLQGS